MKRGCIGKFCCVVLSVVVGIFSTPKESLAVQADPGIFTLTQPDGTTFSARQFGDEWQHRVETTEGYTIIPNQQGYWTYAVQDAAGRLIPSAMIVGAVPPVRMGIARHRSSTNAEVDQELSSIRASRNQ